MSVSRRVWGSIGSIVVAAAVPCAGSVFVSAVHADQPPPATAAGATTAPSDPPATAPSGDATTAPATSPATPKELTLDAILGPDNKVDFDGSYKSGLRWDGSHYLERRDGVLCRIDPLTDDATPAFDRDALAAALLKQGDWDAKAAAAKAKDPGRFSAARSTVLIERDGALYTYRMPKLRSHAGSSARDSGSRSERVRRIAGPPGARGERKVLALSPAGGFVSFVRNNDLHTLDARTGWEHRLTCDGDEHTLNGILDWVYQEEVYGRGNWRGYWWRDDDAFIAFLQLDESEVPVYTIVEPTPRQPAVEQYPYPRAGDPNPRVRVGVVRPRGGFVTWVDLKRYADADPLVVRVDWAPDGRLLLQVQDRQQRWLALCDADPRSGATRELIREQTAAWVEPLGAPRFLPDGSLIWLSERDGWRHAYHYRRDGSLIRPVTRGDWDVESVHVIDESARCVYVSGSRETPLEDHVYRVPLDGGEAVRLTELGWSHAASFDEFGRFFIDTFSNLTTPPKVHLRRSDGSLVRVISANDTQVAAEYDLVTPDLVRVPARDGAWLNGMILRPQTIAAGQRLPVWFPVYAGPASPTVSNRWGGTNVLMHQYLVQRGYVVFAVDPRSASGHGAVSAWQAYRRLGEQELADLEDAAKWIASQGYADPSRFGIYGFSYGGFMTCYAMTHSDVFRLGIAGGSVTDWRYYDSIYTERFMLTPKENEAGYDATSTVKKAERLSGRLLLVHGAIDENVHFKNTLELMLALQKHRKQFDMMLYPRDRHGIGEGRRHFAELRLDYILEGL
ncbi:MAG: DPP IV N-terminal domain-containing protein [Phycisphaerae bacterium]